MRHEDLPRTEVLTFIPGKTKFAQWLRLANRHRMSWANTLAILSLGSQKNPQQLMKSFAGRRTPQRARINRTIPRK
jgi:hypothetical protein